MCEFRLCLGIGLVGFLYLFVRGDEGEDGEFLFGGFFVVLCLVFFFILLFIYIIIKKK